MNSGFNSCFVCKRYESGTRTSSSLCQRDLLLQGNLNSEQMFHLQVVGVILTVFVCACVSFPNRPPISTCEELLPHHDKSISQSLATSPYSVVFTNATYTPGAMMDVRIHGSQRFKGFIIQARAEGSPRPVGTFEGKLADHTRHIWCSGGEPKVGTTWFLNTRPNARAATK